MDHFIGRPPTNVPPHPTVCFVWHWDATIAPESRSAWAHYEKDFDEIVLMFQAQGFRVVAHEHPRWRGEMDKRMADFGIETLDWDENVFDEADVMIVDNSSMATEFMLLGRPVIFLNAPWYRREVNHGGRFWEWTIGHPIVDSAEELVGLNLWDYVLPSPAHQAAIDRTAAMVYAYRDGTSSERAAAFVASLVAGR